MKVISKYFAPIIIIGAMIGSFISDNSNLHAISLLAYAIYYHIDATYEKLSKEIMKSIQE